MIKSTSKTLQLSHSTCNFLDLGTGPVILLVHGFPLDHSMWRHQLAPLSKTHRVLCPDVPGFGGSRFSGPTYSLRVIVDELIELLDRLEIETITFCGLSMGGYLGWQFWKYYPQRMSKLIACNTRAGADNETVARGRRLSAQSIREQGLGNLANEMLTKMFAPNSFSNQPESIEQVRKMIDSTIPESVALGQLAMAERPDATAWLETITIPSLFVGGEFDVITPPNEMRSNCEKVIGAQFEEISQAGHLTPLENPSEFNAIVQTFLLN